MIVITSVGLFFT